MHWVDRDKVAVKLLLREECPTSPLWLEDRGHSKGHDQRRRHKVSWACRVQEDHGIVESLLEVLEIGQSPQLTNIRMAIRNTVFTYS
jgi:hypothetical protein